MVLNHHNVTTGQTNENAIVINDEKQQTCFTELSGVFPPEIQIGGMYHLSPTGAASHHCLGPVPRRKLKYSVHLQI